MYVVHDVKERDKAFTIVRVYVRHQVSGTTRCTYNITFTGSVCTETEAWTSHGCVTAGGLFRSTLVSLPPPPQSPFPARRVFFSSKLTVQCEGDWARPRTICSQAWSILRAPV
jgi:hypothetical protein